MPNLVRRGSVLQTFPFRQTVETNKNRTEKNTEEKKERGTSYARMASKKPMVQEGREERDRERRAKRRSGKRGVAARPAPFSVPKTKQKPKGAQWLLLSMCVCLSVLWLGVCNSFSTSGFTPNLESGMSHKYPGVVASPGRGVRQL